MVAQNDAEIVANNDILSGCRGEDAQGSVRFKIMAKKRAIKPTASKRYFFAPHELDPIHRKHLRRNRATYEPP